MAKAFARAAALFALVQAAMGDMAKLALLPEYKSRGKGLGRHSGKKWGPRPPMRDMVRVKTETRGEVWLQKENGDREVKRRLYQMARNEARQYERADRPQPYQRAALNALGA